MSSWDVSRLTVALGLHTLKPTMDPQLTKRVRRVTRHKNFNGSTLVSPYSLGVSMYICSLCVSPANFIHSMITIMCKLLYIRNISSIHVK